MGRPRTTIKAKAEKLCRDFPGTASQTLARRLYNENKEALTVNAAKLQIRRARGKQGEFNRKYKAVERTSKPSDNALQCPPSAAEPWLPVQIDGPCRVLSLSDIHIPYHSKEAVEAAVKYGKKLKPDVLLLNGDAMDFYRGSRFQQDPNKRSLKQELDSGKELLAWLRSQFKTARIIYKMGNHDERWDLLIWNRAPELFDVKNVQLHNMLDFEKHGVERVGDNPVCAGKLPILHGHEFGKGGIAAPVNPARGAFLRTNHTVLVGHLHRPSSHAEPNMWHDETMTWSTGCLCALQPEYARINKWAWGFADVEVAKDGQFNVHNHRLSSDYQVRSA